VERLKERLCDIGGQAPGSPHNSVRATMDWFDGDMRVERQTCILQLGTSGFDMDSHPYAAGRKVYRSRSQNISEQKPSVNLRFSR